MNELYKGVLKSVNVVCTTNKALPAQPIGESLMCLINLYTCTCMHTGIKINKSTLGADAKYKSSK